MTIAQTRPAGATLALPAGRALRALPATALLVDLGAILLACTAGVLGRNSLGIFEPYPNVATMLGLAGPLLVVGWVLALGAVGAYQPDVFGAGADEFKRVAHATLLIAAIVGITCYLAKFQLSRGFFVLLFCVGLPSILLGRLVLRSAVHKARTRGNLMQSVLLTGSPEHVDEIARVLSRETWLGYRIAGVLTNDDSLAELTPGGLAVTGHSSNVRAMVADLRPDVVFFADSSLGCSAAMRDVVWDLEGAHTQVVVAPSVADISGERVRVRPVGGLPLIHIEKPRAVQASRWAKRTFDIVGSLALLVAFAPLLAYSALRIWAHDRGPVLFSHTRIGKDGAEFACLKFRTMVTDAESLLADLRLEQGADALLFKMKDDPRITVPGRWLRRFSFDELPQLVNVLRGDMSLVGPRPQVADEVAQYRGGMARRLLVRPGMTGLWQVSGRSDLSADEAMRLDIFYVDNWSMVQDLAILGRTFGAVLGSRGAY
jgi:exopolysaccharide biosynthesis polyprenyl glycosylphosphotransferase